MKPLFDAYDSVRQINGSGKCPVMIVCGESTEKRAVVLRALAGMMGDDGIYPFCMDLDLGSCSLGLPGTVSGAPLIKSDAGFPPCFYTKLPYDEKATISFLYGNTQINDLEFYMQLVENLTARVALLMKSDPQRKSARAHFNNKLIIFFFFKAISSVLS